MKKILILTLLVGAASVCFGQNVRYSVDFPSVSSITSTPFLVANTPPNSPVLAVCQSPANQVPCTNFAATFDSLGNACPNGAQDTPDPNPSACQSTGDAQGNIAFWAPAGKYDYTVCVANNCFGPYTVTLGGSGGGGGGSPTGPTFAVQVNDGVGGFLGDAGFLFNPNTQQTTITGALSTGNITAATYNGGGLSGTFTGNPILSGNPNFTGSPVFNFGSGGPFCVHATNGVLTVTASDCGAGGGGISGSGTSNSLAKWTSSSSIGNSGIQEISSVLGTTEKFQVIGTNVFNEGFNSTTGTCASLTSPAWLQGQASCFGIDGQINPAGTTTGFTAAVEGLAAPTSAIASTSPYIVGVHGNAFLSANGSPAWLAGVAGVTGTNGTGTVGTASGVYGLGMVGNGAGSSGQNAAILEGVGGEINVNNSGMTTPVTADFYAHSPTLTGTSTNHYGLFIADQTFGGAKNPNPHALWTIGTAPSQFGGPLTVLGNLTTNVTGIASQCLQVTSAGIIGGTGAVCGGAGFPSGTGIPQVVGGSAWGSTLSETGSGNVVLSNSPTLVTPNLGTPSTLVLTSATGLPLTTGVTGTVQIANLGASGTPSATTFLRGDNAWATPAGSGDVSGPGASTTNDIASFTDATGTLIKDTGILSSNLTTQTSNGAANQVCTYTGANKICVPGTVGNAALTNSSVTFNGTAVALGASGTIPFQVNGSSMTSQAGINHLTSTTNAVGLTVTPVNSATNALKFEVTGGTYNGNATGLTGTPSITVNALTATTINGATLAGTFPGSPTFSGNPVFGGSPVFAMSGGPFCVQETAGVLSSSGAACGTGSGPGTGTANFLTAWNGAGNSLVSVGSAISGQVPVFQNGAAPVASSPSLFDSGSSPITTSPYVIQCDSATTTLDRSTTMRLQSGASTITVPLSSASGCSGLATLFMNDGAGTVTFNRTGGDTFSVFNGSASSDAQTSFTITDGEFASLSQSATGIWEARITTGGTLTSITAGSGLSGGTITSSGTIAIAAGGVTNAMLAGSITLPNLANQSANTVLGKFTSGAGPPVATAVASCSGNNNGNTYTTNTGFTCGSNFGQLNVASTWTALQAFGTSISIGGVTAGGATGTGNVVFGTSPTITSSTLTGASTVVPSGATLTIQSGGTLTCAGGSTCPTGTGTVTHTGTLTATALVTGNAGADITTPSTGSTLSGAGNLGLAGTLTATLGTFSGAGTSASPGLIITGAADTADGSTNNYPQLYVRSSAVAPTTWSANGTQFGINAQSAFAGNLIDTHVNGGISIFKVDTTGGVILTPGGSIGSNNTGTPTINFATNSIQITQPVTIGKTTNQLVLGVPANLTTLNFPAPSGAVTVTGPNVTTTLAAADVALTYNSLQTFGANASIGATAHGVLVSENASAAVATAAGTAGQVLTSNGSGADPTWQGGGLATGTSVSLTAPSEIFVCTSTCTVTPPVPAANYQFCVMNDDNVSTVITLAALGSSARYENTARTAYGTAGTGTLVSTAAAGSMVCIVGRDSTHYLTVNFNGTWTAN